MYLRLKAAEEISYETNAIKRTILCPFILIAILFLVPFSFFIIYKYFGHQDSVLLLILILGSLIFLIVFMLPVRAIVYCINNRNKRFIKYPISALIINVAILAGLFVFLIMGGVM